MTEHKMVSRHVYMAETGKRISKGAWERLHTSYDVFVALDGQGRRKAQVCEWDSKGKPTMQRLCVTHVLKRESTKANRKRTMNERYMPKTGMQRYRVEPIGEHR